MKLISINFNNILLKYKIDKVGKSPTLSTSQLYNKDIANSITEVGKTYLQNIVTSLSNDKINNKSLH